MFSVIVYSHAPTEIIGFYNDSTDILSVSVMHSVPSASMHYIKTIKIKVNGDELAVQKFKKQSSKERQSASYFLQDLKENDKIEIFAECNIFGKKQTVILLPKKEE